MLNLAKAEAAANRSPSDSFSVNSDKYIVPSGAEIISLASEYGPEPHRRLSIVDSQGKKVRSPVHYCGS